MPRELSSPLFLAAASLALSFVLALPLAFARNSASRLLRYAVLAYTLVFRGTPLLVQLFLIYFGLAQFELVRSSLLWPWLSSPLVCCAPCLRAEFHRLQHRDFRRRTAPYPGWRDRSARAYGMSPWTRGRRILIPAMLTRSLPLYGNEMIMMLHATSLASTVTLLEITGVARTDHSELLRPVRALRHRGGNLPRNDLRARHGLPTGAAALRRLPRKSDRLRRQS